MTTARDFIESAIKGASIRMSVIGPEAEGHLTLQSITCDLNNAMKCLEEEADKIRAACAGLV